MLYKIVLKCEYNGSERINHNWASTFHGFLMKELPEEASKLLHQKDLRPFSQYTLANREGYLIWTINLLDCELSQLIIEKLMSLNRIYLKQKDTDLIVLNTEKSFLDEQQYFSRFFNDIPPCRRFELEFLTPCAHKQGGEYVMFPNIETIVNSLFKRYNAFVKNISLNDEAAKAHIIKNLKIARYSLYSSVFYLERTKITGYKGKVTVTIRGPEQLVRLAGALLSYGEYSGLGIKTALGMGAMKVTPIYAPQEAN